jgi:hypothetical protein
MTNDYVNPEKREAEVKKRSSRLLNWMKKEWKVSAKGNLYTKKNGLHIVLGKNERGRYYYSIDRTFAKNTYPNMLAAKKAIFNSLENMRD